MCKLIVEVGISWLINKRIPNAVNFKIDKIYDITHTENLKFKYKKCSNLQQDRHFETILHNYPT